MTTCDYQNNGATITQPGKFEGEPVFAPHFWNLGLEGFADDDDGEWFGFKITAEDVAKWPQLAGKNRIALHEDAAGFVWSYLYP